MKKIVLIVLLFTVFSCRSQMTTKLSFETLRPQLIDFLYSKKQIDNERAAKLKSGENTFNLRGVYNNLSSGSLKNGMYAFSSFSSHSMAYFVLVDGDNFVILDIDTRNGLDNAIKNTLDFCERNKFCVDISNDYVSRLISVYYNKNKNPLSGQDVNCERGVKDTKELP